MKINFIRLKKDLAGEYFRRGISLLNEGKYKEAASNFKMSLNFRSSAETHTKLAEVYKANGYADESIEQAYTALQIDNEYGEAYNIIADYYYTSGFFKEAFAYFRKAINSKNNPKKKEAYYYSGKILTECGVWCCAVNNYREALRIDPDYQEAKEALEKLNYMMN